jgi:hypothetical protein
VNESQIWVEKGENGKSQKKKASLSFLVVVDYTRPWANVHWQVKERHRFFRYIRILVYFVTYIFGVAF